MSEVASKALCAELYKLTGWTFEDDTDIWSYPHYTDKRDNFVAPKYSCGYLLRKFNGLTRVNVARNSFGRWFAKTENNATGRQWEAQADTPEDALCKLAILLVKQGIVPKGEK